MESDKSVREVGPVVPRLGLGDGLRGWRRLDRGFWRGSRYMHPSTTSKRAMVHAQVWTHRFRQGAPLSPCLAQVQ